MNNFVNYPIFYNHLFKRITTYQAVTGLLKLNDVFVQKIPLLTKREYNHRYKKYKITEIKSDNSVYAMNDIEQQ